MKLGVIVPQKEIGLDAGALRAFAQGAEDLGFHHLVAFDSVFTETPYHEPLALFALLAGCTNRIELMTGVIVAPSRQTRVLRGTPYVSCRRIVRAPIVSRATSCARPPVYDTFVLLL